MADVWSKNLPQHLTPIGHDRRKRFGRIRQLPDMSATPSILKAPVPGAPKQNVSASASAELSAVSLDVLIPIVIPIHEKHLRRILQDWVTH
jgi:hypothetical protein